MKIFITLLILFISNLTFAGGSVGTMKTAQEQLQNGILKTNKKELIFNMGTKEGIQKFAHAKLVQGQWEVSEHLAPIGAIQVDYNFSQTLLESKVIQDWAELK